MKASSLGKLLLKMPAEAEVYIVMPSGRAVPLKSNNISTVKASPKLDDEGSVTLIRSKRAKRRVIISVGEVTRAGIDDTPVVPVAHRALDI